MENNDKFSELFGRIIACGDIKKIDAAICERFNSSFYALVYVIEGIGWFHSDSVGSINITAGDCFLLYPEIPHQYGPRKNESWRELYITFTGPVFDSLFSADILPAESSVIKLSPVEKWAWKIRELFDDTLKHTSKQRVLNVNKLISLLIEIDIYRQQSDVPEWLNDAMLIMSASKTIQFDYANLADQLGISYDKFRKDFKLYTGESPAKFNNHQIMTRAGEMLFTGEYNVKEIAHKLGFYDLFHFSRRFKEYTGKSPRHFISGVKYDK